MPTVAELLPYAETPIRRVRQLLADAAVLGWCVYWWRTADGVRDQILALQGAGARAEAAGTGISERLQAAGSAVDGVPFAGRALASALRSAASTGNDLADAGRSAQAAVRSTAQTLHTTLLVVMVGLVAVWWLLRRLRWTATAIAARRLRVSPAGLQVLGLRAAANAPLSVVARVARVRDGGNGLDAATLTALGIVELDRLGLAPPPG